MKEDQISLRAMLVGMILIALGFAGFRYAILLPFLARLEKQRAREQREAVLQRHAQFITSNEFHNAIYAAGASVDGDRMHFGPQATDERLQLHLAPIWPLVRDGVISCFTLTESRVTKDGLAFLPPYAYQLDLSDTRLGDDGVDALAAFPGLKLLHLDRTDVTAAGLRRLGQVAPQLQRLDIDGLRFADGDVELLAAFPHLQRVSLRGADVTTSGVQQLARVLPGLTCLCVDGSAINTPEVALLFPNLEELAIARVAPAGSIAVLAKHPHLRWITLSYPEDGATAAAIKTIRLERPDIALMKP